VNKVDRLGGHIIGHFGKKNDDYNLVVTTFWGPLVFRVTYRLPET